MENTVDIDITEEKPAEDPGETKETAAEESYTDEAAETNVELCDNSNNESNAESCDDSDNEPNAESYGDGDDFASPPGEFIEPSEAETRVKKPFPIKKILTISGIVCGSLAAIYIAGVIFYSSHFFFNTKIENFDCSNLSVEAAAERIKTDIDDYSLNMICRGEASEQVSGKDITLVYGAMGNLEELKKRQNPFLWATDYTCRDLDVDIEISYDETALLEKLKSLECVKKSDAAMEGAAENVYFDEDSMTYMVKDSNSPDIISLNKLLEKSKLNISGLYRNMDLDAEGCYVSMADEDKMHGALETLNRYVSTKVTYPRGDESSMLDAGTIHTWLTLNDDYTVTIDSDALDDWVDDLAKLFNTVGSTRKFKTNSGNVVEVSGGDYGWRVNTSAESETLTENIKEGGEYEREPAYSQTAGKHGAGNDLPGSYVEVSLDAQHVWYYKDGSVSVSTDCVTGDPTKNNATHTGTYYIKYKERNATLKGEDYETPVDYWMPFNGGEGLHDLSSRGAFGGSIYRGNGSHGCVNLPHSAAQKIYESIERGVPVIVY